MIDIKKIREEFDATVEQLARRGVEKANVQKAKDLDKKCMNRRDFLAVSGMAGAAALTKCATASATAVKPEPKFVWQYPNQEGLHRSSRIHHSSEPPYFHKVYWC